MADRTINLNITGNASGAAGSLKQVQAQMAAARKEIENLTRGQLSLNAAGRIYNVETGQTVAKSRAAAIAAEERRMATVRLATAMNTLRAVDAASADALERSTSALTRNNRALGQSANAIGAANIGAISLAQAFQDMGQFGIGAAQGLRAVMNNVQQLGQNVMYEKERLGSYGAAFRNLKGAIMGPAGALVAFSLITGAIELVSNRLQQSKKDTEEAKDAYESLLSVATPEGDIKKLTAPLDILAEAAKTATTNLENTKRARERLVEAGTVAPSFATPFGSAFLGRGGFLAPEAGGVAGALGTTAINQEAALQSITGVISRQAEEENKLNDLRAAGLEAYVQDFLAYRRELQGVNEDNKVTIDQYAQLVADGETQKFLAEARTKEAERLKKITDDILRAEKERIEAAWDLRRARVEALMLSERELKIAERLIQGMRPVVPMGALERFSAAAGGGVITKGGELRPEAMQREGAEAGIQNIRTLSDATIAETERVRQSMLDMDQSFFDTTRGWFANNKETITQFTGIIGNSLGTVGTSFMQLAQTGEGVNKRMFQAGKAFAMANAVINTAEGVTKALAMKGPLGIIAGAAVAAAGAAQIAVIAAAQPGSSTVRSPGGGGSSFGGGSNTLLGSTNTLESLTAPTNPFRPAWAMGASVAPSGSARVSGELVGSGRTLVGVIREEIAAQRRMGVRDPLGVGA